LLVGAKYIYYYFEGDASIVNVFAIVTIVQYERSEEQ
jgi:hypothetical protein